MTPQTPSSPSFPRALATHVAGTSVDAWSAAARGAGDYWAGALARRATPLDLWEEGVDWWHAMTDRRPPTWSSPNDVVLASPIAALRDFSRGSRRQVVPTLVLPPQAGHHSCIVDYSADQSQINTIRAAGLERVYSLEWIGATQATKNAGIDDYLGFLEESIELIGGPVNLVGDCQGGWLTAIYAALHPDHVNTLTLAGAPIDFHAGNGVIREWVSLLCQTGDLSIYEGIVAAGGGVMPGARILDGFVLIRPDNEIGKQLNLLADLHDAKHRERYRAFEDWFKWTQDIPGAFYLWLVAELFRDNKLIAGELEIRGRRVDLGVLDMPLYLLAGETDHITPPPQVFAAAHAVSTPAERIARRTTSGGHLGLFMGREALREHWPPILADMLTHSKPGARPAPAERRARGATPSRGRTIPAP